MTERGRTIRDLKELVEIGVLCVRDDEFRDVGDELFLLDDECWRLVERKRQAVGAELVLCAR